VNALALVLNENFRRFRCLELWWLGDIYSPQPPTSRWVRLLSMGAPDSLVRHWTVSGAPPRHPTVRVLEQSTVGGFVLMRHRTVRCATEQVLFTVRCASDTTTLTLRPLFFTVHVSGRCCSRPLRWIVIAPLVHRTVRWHTGQSDEL
jgi:hypothetical protein